MSTTTRPAVKKTAAKKTIAAKKTVSAKPRAKAPASKAKTAAAAKPATLKQAVKKTERKVTSVVHMTRDASFKLIDTQRAIWLAGLGALAKVTASTGTKGEKAFEALVKAGEKIESQARGAIDSNADLLKSRIGNASKVMDDGIDTVSEAFDARVKQALSRLGYPKK
jgi:poly(hydroxyalkanoate) granule-associated protein